MLTHEIPGSLDTSMAGDALQNVVDFLADSKGKATHIEIEHSSPTQVTLQILAATYALSHKDECEMTFGPQAEAQISRFLKQDGDD